MNDLAWFILGVADEAGEAVRDTRLNAFGATFLIISLSFVWGLTGWCFYKVLTLKEDRVVEPPDSLGG